jgi:very-short-patch-repair endonuclease
MDAPKLTLDRARQLRKTMSPPEAALWIRLRNQGLNRLKFRRQHPLGPYILDFYCDSVRLAVEVDGAAHHSEAQASHDGRRDLWLASQGVRTLRVSTAWVRKDMDGLLRHIAEVAADAGR